MLIDTHAHLNMEPLYAQWREVLAESIAAGVEMVIVPGASMEMSRIGVSIANEASAVWAAVGIHPEEAGEKSSDWQLVIGELEQLAVNKKVIAIGECGLDYYRTSDNKELQKELFQLQVDLARKLALPVIVHTREKEAIEDAKAILADYSQCVYHCFSGDSDPGTYVGIGGTITYKGNDALREVVAQIPLERIILETDAPWLSPEPVRGTTNVPANVTITALKLAELKDVPLSQIMEQTSKNVKQLFLKNL
jgi:TatD DNase family protein